MLRTARHITFALTCALFAVGEIAAANEAASATERESRSAAGFQRDRGAEARRELHTYTDRSGAPVGRRPATSAVTKGGRTQSAQCCAFRFFSVDTELFDDFDGDGYYTFLRVTFDVDTDFVAADVYADVFVAPIGEPWELVFESDVFTIFGSAPDDDFEVDTEFVNGYPPGDYDVLIDIYDAVSGELVATVGPADSSALAFLPIEDISFDSATDERIVISGGGGGSLSLVTLFALLWARHRRGAECRVNVWGQTPINAVRKRGSNPHLL